MPWPPSGRPWPSPGAASPPERRHGPAASVRPGGHDGQGRVRDRRLPQRAAAPQHHARRGQPGGGRRPRRHRLPGPAPVPPAVAGPRRHRVDRRGVQFPIDAPQRAAEGLARRDARRRRGRCAGAGGLPAVHGAGDPAGGVRSADDARHARPPAGRPGRRALHAGTGLRPDARAARRGGPGRGAVSAPALQDIRACFEGAIPGVVATCSAEGVPNVAYISQVFYVDERHVALSFQFFNKTRQNIQANPYATTLVLHPGTARFYRLHLRYVRTETEGPLFEGMRAQLAGIASHTGMQGVFRLLGSDVYQVEEIEALEGDPLPPPPPRTHLLGAVRRTGERLARCTGLDEALNVLLASLNEHLGIRHAMVLMLDPAAQRLYTVASCGYPTSGVGSEIGVGQGVIGMAARERTPVRIGYMTTAALYSQAMRSSFDANVPDFEPVTEIPYPGLAQPQSQLAVPIASSSRMLGVLFVESTQELQFSFEDEDALVAIAGHLGAVIDLTQAATESTDGTAAPAAPASASAPAAVPPLAVRHFPANDSIFFGDSYVIKGVAGAILWKLLRDHRQLGRTEFSNRELRLDPALKLPDVTDNLEARLLLLQRRLAEQGAAVRMEKTGRGRFRLVLQRPVELIEV
ncbi:MAG: GAF domain-containing protein [Burkholderiales bacterium]|nr:GAF domain-containing protein [Burkholderiales bacterium]